MGDIFFDKIRDIFPVALDRMVGYSELEITKIEKLYGIVVSGEFASLLRRAGRSDGGLVGDDPLIIYRPRWSVRAHLLFQMKLFNSLQDIGAWDYLNKPFVFSLESETQYYFLITGDSGGFVYHYDENEETVKNTGMSLFEYLLDVVDRYTLGGLVCKGDLLNI